MFVYAVGIIFAIAIFCFCGINKIEVENRYGTDIKYVFKPQKKQFFAIIPLTIILLISMVAIVPTGYTGILTTFGKVEERIIQPGVNIIAPWQKIIKMDNRTQKQIIETEAFSSDIQQVDIIITLNYNIDKSDVKELYSSVGVDYYETILKPRALEGTKTVFAGYTAEELVTNRVDLSVKILELISSDISDYGINISGVSIENLDFTDAFTDAVEAKQVATQNKLTAETKQEQLTLEAEAQAKRKLIEAEAEAERKIIEAKAEAEANRLISDSITHELIEMMEVEARKEHGWITVQGANAVVTMP